MIERSPKMRAATLAGLLRRRAPATVDEALAFREAHRARPLPSGVSLEQRIAEFHARIEALEAGATSLDDLA